MSALREDNGKQSFARGMGAVVVMCLCAVFLGAAVCNQWETVRVMGGELSLLAAGLYGFNKMTGMWQTRTPAQPPQGQP